MGIKATQFKLTSGELDPLLLGRTDLEKYYGAAEFMSNMSILSQGGARRADGLEYIGTALNSLTKFIPNGNVTAPRGGDPALFNDDNRDTIFSSVTPIGTRANYTAAQIVFGGAPTLKFVDLLDAKLTTQTNSQWQIQARNITNNWVVIANNVTLSPVPQNFRIPINFLATRIRFRRSGSIDLGTDVVSFSEFKGVQEAATPSVSKLVPFAFNAEQSYMLVITGGNIAVYRNKVFLTNIITPSLTEAIIPRLKYTQSADTMLFTHPDLPPKRLVRGLTETEWSFESIVFDSIPKFDFNPTSVAPASTLTPSFTTGVLTVTSSGADFLSSDVGQYVQGGGGRARILELVSTTIVRVATEIPFYSTAVIPSGSWRILRGFEDVWSSTRGYPVSVAFHEGRLWFGGSRSRPQTLWGSAVGLFFDFNLGALTDADAIDATLDTDQVNAIENLQSINSNFIIFTVGGEFAVPKGLNQPITPTNFSVRKQGQAGSSVGFNVGAIGNNSIFIQRGGKSILKYNFDVLQETFVAENISLVSGHLIANPADFAVRQATSTEEGNIVLYVDTAGKIANGTILFDQGVIGFTPRTTNNGLFRNVGVDISTIYTIIERVINGVTLKYIETYNAVALLDSSKIITTGLPAATFTGLDHLEGETVKVIADGSVLQDRVVVGGSITIERNAITSVEIGLDMTPNLKTLPIEVPQLGTRIGQRKRISNVVLRVKDTGDFTVNANDVFADEVSFRGFGLAGAGSPLDAPPPLFTGDKKVSGLLGWNERKQIVISQTQPTKLNILSLTVNVST